MGVLLYAYCGPQSEYAPGLWPEFSLARAVEYFGAGSRRQILQGLKELESIGVRYDPVSRVMVWPTAIDLERPDSECNIAGYSETISATPPGALREAWLAKLREHCQGRGAKFLTFYAQVAGGTVPPSVMAQQQIRDQSQIQIQQQQPDQGLAVAAVWNDEATKPENDDGGVIESVAAALHAHGEGRFGEVDGIARRIALEAEKFGATPPIEKVVERACLMVLAKMEGETVASPAGYLVWQCRQLFDEGNFAAAAPKPAPSYLHGCNETVADWKRDLERKEAEPQPNPADVAQLMAIAGKRIGNGGPPSF